MTTEFGSSMSVTIDARIDDVWAAITTPERIRDWFLGVETRGEWVPGGELTQTGEWQGRPYESKAVIDRIEPPVLLQLRHWSPMSGRPDEAEHYETVVYRLSERDGATELTITESNLPSEQARQLSERIWTMALENLAQMLEA